MIIEEPNCQADIRTRIPMDSFGSPSQDSFCSPREARMVLARPFLEKIVFHTRATAILPPIKDGT